MSDWTSHRADRHTPRPDSVMGVAGSGRSSLDVCLDGLVARLGSARESLQNLLGETQRTGSRTPIREGQAGDSFQGQHGAYRPVTRLFGVTFTGVQSSVVRSHRSIPTYAPQIGWLFMSPDEIDPSRLQEVKDLVDEILHNTLALKALAKVMEKEQLENGGDGSRVEGGDGGIDDSDPGAEPDPPK